MYQARWKGLQSLACIALEETENIADHFGKSTAAKWQADTPRMVFLLQHTSRDFQLRVEETACVQQRASVQIQGPFNIIAQREQELSRQLARDNLRLAEAMKQVAEDSKCDSTSMKAIAAVTMFFLPGTFAASLLAMPIFSWSATSGKDVVSHRIWVYRAVAIPLTMITFGCFLLWDHLMNKPRYEQLKPIQDASASLLLQSTRPSSTSASTVRSRVSVVSRHSQH